MREEQRRSRASRQPLYSTDSPSTGGGPERSAEVEGLLLNALQTNGEATLISRLLPAHLPSTNSSSSHGNSVLYVCEGCCRCRASTGGGPTLPTEPESDWSTHPDQQPCHSTDSHRSRGGSPLNELDGHLCEFLTVPGQLHDAGCALKEVADQLVARVPIQGALGCGDYPRGPRQVRLQRVGAGGLGPMKAALAL